MKLVRRVELLHSKEDLENATGAGESTLESILPISSLRECSFYTNGSRLIMVQQEGSMKKDKKNKNKKVAQKVEASLKHFDLNTGHQIPKARSERELTAELKKLGVNYTILSTTVYGLPTVYDYVNNLIWNCSSSGGYYTAVRNENLAPSFSFNSKIGSAQSLISSLESTLRLDKLSSKSFEVNKWSIFGQSAAYGFAVDLGPSFPPTESAAYIIANLSRLAEFHEANMTDLQFNQPPLSPEDCVRKPHCIHLNPETFKLLSSMLTSCSSKYFNEGTDSIRIQTLLHLLILLKVNLHYLIVGSIPPAAVGLKTSESGNSVLDNIAKIIFSIAEKKPAANVDINLVNHIQGEAFKIISLSLHILKPLGFFFHFLSHYCYFIKSLYFIF